MVPHSKLKSSEEMMSKASLFMSDITTLERLPTQRSLNSSSMSLMHLWSSPPTPWLVEVEHPWWCPPPMHLSMPRTRGGAQIRRPLLHVVGCPSSRTSMAEPSSPAASHASHLWWRQEELHRSGSSRAERSLTTVAVGSRDRGRWSAGGRNRGEDQRRDRSSEREGGGDGS